MGFRYRPRIKIGNATFGKTGVSFRTGIPGLTFRHDYKRSSKSRSAPIIESEPSPPTVVKAVLNTIGFVFMLTLAAFFWSAIAGAIFNDTIGRIMGIGIIGFMCWVTVKPGIEGYRTGEYKGRYLSDHHRTIIGVESGIKTLFSLALGLAILFVLR
ncbi:hypothetical protein WBJ53_14840 [Spirosoma sp. SC4-14]|uniref:hypothetical protein n=1 Tax=Spirosoma sp. SC4-14 TaxID=3128900 RepID=UPI0030D4760A